MPIQIKTMSCNGQLFGTSSITSLQSVVKESKFYTCCVCCKIFHVRSLTSIFSLELVGDERVCSKMCAHTVSQTFASVQGFVLCKVLSIFLDNQKNKQNTTHKSKETDEVIPDVPVKAELPELSDVFLPDPQESESSSHAELPSFQPRSKTASLLRQKITAVFQSRKKSLRRHTKRESTRSSSVTVVTHKRAKGVSCHEPRIESDRKTRKARTVRGKTVCKNRFFASEVAGKQSIHDADKISDLSCSECGKRFSTRKTMKAHLKVKHKKDLSRNKVCRICGQGFSRQVGLSLHMANKHRGEKAVECETCGERFSSSTDHDRHMTLVHGKQRGVCHICGKHFKYLHTLQAHVRAHTGVRAFVCEICGKGFLRQTTLLDHKKRHFCKDCKKDLTLCECPRPEKKRIIVESNGAFQCRFCGEILQTFDLFETHIGAHKMERPYGCTLCDKRFMEKTGLRAHMHQHKEKRFQCDICQKTFTYKCNLKHHRENHNVEGRPFPCDICQKTFKTENALKVHKDVHFEERRVNCHICGKSLTRVTNLKRHLKVMHPESAIK